MADVLESFPNIKKREVEEISREKVPQWILILEDLLSKKENKKKLSEISVQNEE